MTKHRLPLTLIPLLVALVAVVAAVSPAAMSARRLPIVLGEDHEDHDEGGTNAKSFVYVITNPDGPNAVEAYSRDRRTGTLTHLGRFETGGSGDPFVGGFEQHSVIAEDGTLYAVNPGSDTISAFSIQKDGTLGLLGQVPSGGRRPVSLTANKDFLYVANEGNVPGSPVEQASYSGFRIDKDGSLSPISDSTVLLNPGDSPSDVLFDKEGRVLIGNRLPGNMIDSFAVGKDGRLTNQQTIPGGGGPFGLILDRHREHVLVTLAVPEFFPNEDAPGVASYNIARDGTLTHVDSYTDPDISDEGLRDPCWLAGTPNDDYVWTSSFIPRMLTLFHVDHDGGLTRVSDYNPMDSVEATDPSTGLPVMAVIGSTDIDVSKDGKFLYQLRAFSVPDAAVPVVPRIEVLRVTKQWGTNGGLRPVESVLLPEDLSETGVMGLAVVENGDD